MKTIQPPQIDDYVPTAFLRYIGAARTFASRSRFYFSYPQFLIISLLAYANPPLNAVLQQVFPNIYFWGAFLVLLLPVAMLFEYSIVYPSQITFNRHQTARENRDPVYRSVQKLHRRFDAVESKLDGERVAVPDGCGCIELAEHLSAEREN